MAEPLVIPKEMKTAFEQVMSLAPETYRADIQFQQSILLYLKLGGEKLARQRIDLIIQTFCEEFNIGKKRADGPNETDVTAEDESEEEEARENQDKNDKDG
jgi:hypothetical protein